MKSEVKSTCCYCGVGCGVLIERDGEQITGVRGDPEHPANWGRLCTKGASLHLAAQPASRLLYPEQRPTRGGAGQRVSWDVALETAATRFAEIIRAHGPNSVAFYVSGQLLTEDYYVFNKLAKGLVGANNIDTNSRLCMSSAVAGYKQTLGVDAPPCCYDDIAQAGTLLIAGANPAVAHPIVFRRIEDARAANPDLKIVVVDPRRSETAEIADLHLAIRPGSDIALYNGLLNILINEERIDRAYIEAHTEGFAELCGIASADLLQAARWFAGNGPALSLYCQGLNQSAHGTHNNAALIHLHLATGQIGRPGAGPFSLTGQPNAMGGREVGGLANLLPAHRDLANPAHRSEVARFWGVPHIPAQAGKAAVDLFRALHTGEIKAVWIACTNPAQSLPNQPAVRAALQAAEYVVVQEAFADTDTADYADLLLPASAWGEKHGTVTNSERRISRVLGAVPPPGEARHDWEIAVDFARRLGAALDHPATERLFPYTASEQIFNEHRATTLGRDLDIGGLSYALLEQAGPQQWPFPAGAATGQARLYGDGRFPTPSGRARFVAVQHAGTADSLATAYPISLLSGRMRDQWHGMSRTGSVPRLFNIEDEPLLSMHPCDMRHRGLADGDIVEVRNGRGSLRVRVTTGDGLQRGRAWMPMHWGNKFMNSAGVNALTCDIVDPYSQQPELKHAAVEIERLDLPFPFAVLRRCATRDQAQQLLQRARTQLAAFPYATLGLYGRQSPLVVLRGAAAEALDDSALEQLDRLFELADRPGAIVYTDPARKVAKKAWTSDGALLGVRLAGEALAQSWLKSVMAEGGLDAGLLRLALAPTASAPVALPARNIVCKCADVSDQQIRSAVEAGAGLEQLRDGLKCGSFCGGCLPDLKRLVAEYTPRNPVAA